MAREYKDSGIEWIGQIPREWSVELIGNNIKEINDKNDDSSEDNALQFKMGSIISKKGGDSKYNPESLAAYTKVKEGDIVINGLNLSFDLISQRVGLVREKGVITSTYLTLRPSSLLHSEFVNYLFKAYDNCKAFHGMGRGLRQILAYRELKNQKLIYPPLPEQQKIADYLDKVCGEMDEMVVLQETMIEELKAYKQSVITEAITKGLNPNVPMRDSGIDWIGEIPVHWGVPAIGYLAKITSGSTPDRNNPLFWSEGTVNWIKTGELQNNRLSCSEEKITEYALNNTSIKLYPKDTILMAMYGQGKTRGMTALLDVPCTTNQACAALSIYNKNVDVLFLWKCLMGAYDAIRDKAVGTGQPNLNIDLISKFVIPLPPYNEQVEIVAFIDEVVPQIDSLIALKQAKIEELKEYKKSVIYEYVTGKKEVV